MAHAEHPPRPRPRPRSQKKRVTSGEALAGHARVLYADEISTGLDSNTTYQITKSLRNICHVMKASSVPGAAKAGPRGGGGGWGPPERGVQGVCSLKPWDGRAGVVQRRRA